MSNAPKVGFWQTIPGLITATAGFLSAATGAIVALNQTGVVDLKKIAGGKPAEQTAPAEPQPVTLSQPQAPPVEKRESAPAAEPAISKAEPGRLAQSPPAVPAEAPTKEPDPKEPSKSEPAKPVGEPVATHPQPKELPPPPPSQPPPTEVAPPDSRVAKRDEPATGTVPVMPAPPPTRVEPPVASAPPSSPPQEPPARPAPQNGATTSRPAGQPHIERPPTKSPRPDQVADARVPQREPAPRDGDDAGRARVVRPPPGEMPERRVKEREPAEPGVVRAPSATSETGRGGILDLAGLKMVIPSGWVRSEVEPSPVAPDATLRIPDPSGEVVVNVSRFLGAKGKESEERIIDRWLGQVSQSGGRPMDRSKARIERRQHGTVRVTTVELEGTLKRGPGDPGRADMRMLGAIIDHPTGLHLVVAEGPARSMARWDGAIRDFLGSVRAE